jgi:hypothetical protein
VLYTSYYVIKPNKRLLERLSKEPPDLQELLLLPALWTKEVGGKTVWGEREHMIQVALMFLLNLRQDYIVGNDPHPEVQLLIEELLGSPPYTMEVFDCWWEIEHLDEGEQYEDVEEQMGLEDIQLLAGGGLARIDGWLSFLRDKKSK